MLLAGNVASESQNRKIIVIVLPLRWITVFRGGGDYIIIILYRIDMYGKGDREKRRGGVGWERKADVTMTR